MLCSVVILLFLGNWRMTIIAVLMLPAVALAAGICMYFTGQTINVMTLAGIALADRPGGRSGDRRSGERASPSEDGTQPFPAAFQGTRQVVMPELVATLSTLMVLAPLAIIPSSGQFLFQPMTLAVAFAMVSAMLLALSFVPSRCALWLKPEQQTEED